jgi:hypothetical protein
MYQQYDEEYDKRYELEAYLAVDVAENGDRARIAKNYFSKSELPALDKIATKLKENGFDTFEIREITELKRRYSIM